MTDEKEKLIRDADLLAELASYDKGHRVGRAGLRSVFVLQLIERQQERDKRKAELEAMPREKRRRAIIPKLLKPSPPSFLDVRHIHSVLALCGLPYDRQPLDMRDFERKQGNMAIDVQAGFLRDPNGEQDFAAAPIRAEARLILMHLCSEAIRQKSPTIEIADTFTAFVRDMGFPDSGGKKGPLTAFKEHSTHLPPAPSASARGRVNAHA